VLELLVELKIDIYLLWILNEQLCSGDIMMYNGNKILTDFEKCVNIYTLEKLQVSVFSPEI
jgi:hypothetical protein